MFLLYFYSILAVILVIYMVAERKRLLFYKEVNQMNRQEEYSAQMPISIQKFAQSTLTRIIPSTNTNQSILFEYRHLIYVAMPLDECNILVSRVRD